ncbi:SDR family oxidoreductase [Yinghuangia sp. ASG 101]|uniref:SDR family NAD(P)-dependent oxidoreductase n=1 Tax=Yinghuangia sp. ASG 101 TaxID=2896848 RepID=UPI001E451E9B|nr:SDR family NAD(P)-dependent oxidoreductase [Yinghuangia sp. ASG 101]UGQ13093.1 SDR family oxidoreductase [Yinghuangia sp. ASG 101]
MSDTPVRDRTVLVTGGGSGIGRAMALAFAALGDRVVVADLAAETAAKTVAEVEAAGGTATAVHVDVADEESVAAMTAASVDAYGGLDVVCNNAGVVDSIGLLEEITLAEWRRTLGVNLTGAFLVARAALPHLLETKGSLVNTASVAGLRGAAGGAAYTASKHGVVGLTRSIAYMYREQGVRCNALCPGTVNTNIIQGEISMAGFERLSGVMMNAGAIAEAGRVASVAVFLASDAASHVTGAVLPVDGGWSAG